MWTNLRLAEAKTPLSTLRALRLFYLLNEGTLSPILDGHQRLIAW